LGTIVEETEAESLDDLVNALGASLDAAEQELAEGAVNILTMHKAKGLSADVVLIVGAEDEFIPGRNEGQREGDERRLLFVSMTRARHRLFISYCRKRIGRQAHLGRESGRPDRSLTRFLRDVPLRAEDGIAYISHLAR
jgi:superfamily I DNA/RNA helicase